MPSKSPASPTRPSPFRSRLADGTEVKVIACDRVASELNKRLVRINGGWSPDEGLSHEEYFIAGPRTEDVRIVVGRNRLQQ